MQGLINGIASMALSLKKIKKLFDAKMDIGIDPTTLYATGVDDAMRAIYKQLHDREYAVGREKFSSIKCIKCKKVLCYERVMLYGDIKSVKKIMPTANIYCNTCRQIEEIKK